ncbi:MAG: NHL repeat-containing protein, partial [Coriobacteriia bacterium]|nr:NHL repeat-containing protein [Coriobacteriia bacterium]
VVIGVVALAVSLSLLLEPQNSAKRHFGDVSEDSTATATFVGMFPTESEEPLANPLGIASDGERVFVAESDAGVIRIFDAEGGDEGTIGIVPAGKVALAYPSVIAVADGELAVVDNSANRVIIVSAEPAEAAEVLYTLGEAGEAPRRPTSVAYGNDEWYVADQADGLVKVYDGSGEYERSLGTSFGSSGFVGALEVMVGRLVVAESGAGQVVVLDSGTGERLAVFEDRYSLPRAFAQAEGEILAIADTFERAVFIVTADGDLLGTIDEESVPERSLGSPRGVAWIAGSGRLFITDAAVGRVIVFEVRID